MSTFHHSYVVLGHLIIGQVAHNGIPYVSLAILFNRIATSPCLLQEIHSSKAARFRANPCVDTNSITRCRRHVSEPYPETPQKARLQVPPSKSLSNASLNDIPLRGVVPIAESDPSITASESNLLRCRTGDGPPHSLGP